MMNRARVCKSVWKGNTTWIVICLCGLNLLVMHLYFLCANVIENEVNFTTVVDGILGIVIDVTVLFLLFYLVTWKRLKPALTITFFITLLWSFTNVLYSRFFHHYITLSAIGQGGTLLDAEMIRCTLDGLRWTDMYFVVCTILFFLLIKKARPVNRPVIKMIASLVIMVGVDLLSYLLFCSLTPEYRYISFFVQRIEHRQLSVQLHLGSPNDATYRRGFIRTLAYELLLDFSGTIQLSEEQKDLIAAEIEKAGHGVTHEGLCVTDKNVIFILVESYMSFTSDMSVNGREVTPFLNSLKRDSTVYYNGQMHENVTIGESSDGQFIYMTGLLPLRSVITVSKARHAALPGLPKMLNHESRMVIPTVTSMWNQDEMCRQYGFDHLYASNDYAGGKYNNLNDEQIFQLAMQKDEECHQPFFSVILTMSMHQPYTRQIDPTFQISDTNITEELACYLSACHYTDRQIGQYLEHLKTTGLYEKSLIVIAADHSVHNTDLGGVSKEIPFYIVNIPQELKNRMWQNECNQLDVYTTLLDLFDVESSWFGMGQSLLSPNYNSSVDTKKWELSEWIIRGNYFSNQ